MSYHRQVMYEESILCHRTVTLYIYKYSDTEKNELKNSKIGSMNCQKERRASLIKQKVKNRVFTKQTYSAAEKVIFLKKNQTKTERKKKVFTTHSKYIETKIVLYLV